ncbi:MAG: alkaline phosphatase family protein [Anaerolineales bacterium]
MAPVVICVVDGLRPDAISPSETPMLQRLMDQGRYSLNARTVMPSVTLPCHMSLFHSVDPGRHGVVTNTWTPQVRPVPGLFDVARLWGLKAAAFYNWEELRDLWRPGAVEVSYYWRDNKTTAGDVQVARAAAECLSAGEYDLAFVYLGHTDEAGHHDGWLSPTYAEAVRNADACIGQVLAALGEDWTAVVVADHGGHERSHGTDLPEDMTIPLIMAGRGIRHEQLNGDAQIIDVAPTVAKLVGLGIPEEWEGHVLL